MHSQELFKEISINSNHLAFRKLFEIFHPKLSLFAKRFIEDEDIREDIIQDVFTSLWENRHTIKISSSLTSYLMSMTRNACLNYLRKADTVNTCSLDDHHDDFPDRDISDKDLMLNELIRILDSTIRKLPPDYQQVFLMSRFQDKKSHEIASHLNISIKTVERYKNKIDNVLREMLNEYQRHPSF